MKIARGLAIQSDIIWILFFLEIRSKLQYSSFQKIWLVLQQIFKAEGVTLIFTSTNLKHERKNVISTHTKNPKQTFSQKKKKKKKEKKTKKKKNKQKTKKKKKKKRNKNKTK